MSTALTPPTPLAATPTAVPTAGVGATASSSSDSMLQASIVPAKSVVGYVFKVTEKDTGRVVVEVPFEVSPTDGAAAEAPLAPLVDVKA